MKRLSGQILLSIFLSTCAVTGYAAGPAPVDRIKAAYIYKFTHFVTWPALSLASNGEFNICVLGDDPVINELQPLNMTLRKSYLIRVDHLQSVSRIPGCNILYISDSEQARLHSILEFLFNRPILTISDMPGFVRKGGMIGFVRIDNRIRVEINRDSARQVGIDFSAKLLEIASMVLDARSGER